MKILVACEYSGIVSDAFRKKGHDITSCDLLESESPGKHYTGDILDILYLDNWDMIIGFPPCTYLCKAQMHYYNSVPGRKEKALKAFDFFMLLWKAAPLVCLENPSGYLTTLFKAPDQIIHPWYFGNKHRKQTGLWLKNLPPLISTCYSPGRIPVSNHVNGKMSQKRKSRIKSKFFPEVAAAMADQWNF